MTAGSGLEAMLVLPSLRFLRAVYFLPLLALLALLIERELIRSAAGPRTPSVVRLLEVAVLPLLVAFVVLVALRLSYIF